MLMMWRGIQTVSPHGEQNPSDDSGKDDAEGDATGNKLAGSQLVPEYFQ